MNIELTPESRAQIGDIAMLLSSLPRDAAVKFFDRLLKLIDRTRISFDAGSAVAMHVHGLDALIAEVRGVAPQKGSDEEP